MFDPGDVLSRNSNTAPAAKVNKRLGSARSGTGVPPVNHAQDARATIKLNRRVCLPAFDDLLILLRIVHANCSLEQSDTRTRSRLGGNRATARTVDRYHGRLRYR